MTYIRRIFPWLLAAPTLLPVIVYGGVIYPDLVPKTLTFYALSLLTGAAFIVLVAHGEAFYWDRLKRWETWIPLALGVLAYGTSGAGLGFSHSFWSIFDRGDGLLELTCAIGYFYVLLVYADEAFMEWFFRAVAVMSTIVALYGIGEWLVTGGRIGSLLGNAAFFACYLGVALFATLATARRLPHSWRRWVYVAAALQVIAIVLTATRGTMLALGVAVLVVLLHLATAGKGKTRAWSAGALAAIVLLGGLFFVFRAQLAHVPFSPVARVAATTTKSPDVASRLFIWGNMLGEIAQRPLLGVGSEHIDYLFNQFYNPTQIDVQWVDRSHNSFLDYAAQYGIGGLILYLLLIASFFIGAMRFFRAGDRSLAGAFMLVALVYASQDFFVFDTVTTFWLLLALLALALGVSQRGGEKTGVSFPTWVENLSWPAAFVFVAFIAPVSVFPAIAAYDLAHAYGYQVSDVQKSVAYLQNGFGLQTYGNLEYGYEAYAMYTGAQQQLSGQQKLLAYDEAKRILSIDFQNNPYDARTALYYADVLYHAPSGVQMDRTQFSEAVARAIKLSPKRPQAWYLLVNVALDHANQYPAQSSERAKGYAAAKDLLNQYIALVPDFAEPHYVLAQIDLAAGDTKGAAAQAALGKQYYAGSSQTASRAATYYENAQDWANAVYFLSQLVQKDPQNNSAKLDYAKALYLNGEQAKAVQVVQALQQSDPSILKNEQNFMNAITAYESAHK